MERKRGVEEEAMTEPQTKEAINKRTLLEEVLAADDGERQVALIKLSNWQ